jgi:hypothetical protein
LLDHADGKVATAKNPRKWPNLFAFRATYIEPSVSGAPMRSVRLTLPNGTIATSAQHDCRQALSQALNREVTLAVAERGQGAGVPALVPASWTATAEEYWPDIEASTVHSRRHPMATSNHPTLYERLGGVYSIATVVDDLIDRVMNDPRLNANPRVDEAHHRVSAAGFKYLVTELVCWASGGPQQ